MPTTPTPHSITRNPRLRGLHCLNCGAPSALVLRHTGCAICAQAGVFASLAARYGTATVQVAASASGYRFGANLPYLSGLTLGEGNTPLLALPALAAALGVAGLFAKDESQNPSGSHKDRMSALGVTQALESGAQQLVLASSGNAAISAARYAAAAGLACEVATYSQLPAAYQAQLERHGAQRVAFASNAERWAHVRERSYQAGVFALTNFCLPALGSTPLAVEAYKAIAFEIAEQAAALPDHVLVPTARGDLLWGIYAGFCELKAGGNIARIPKLWAVEPFARLSLVLEGAPLHASVAGDTEQFSTAGSTVTLLQLQAVQGSGGGAVVVGDASAHAMRRQLPSLGLTVTPELCAAAAFAAVAQLRASGAILAHEQVHCLLTANASLDPSFYPSFAEPTLN